jgi:Cu+-exporting ATPase
MPGNTALVKDPVCGMEIAPDKAAVKRTYEGKDVYFCSKGCATAFDSNPGKYSGIKN